MLVPARGCPAAPTAIHGLRRFRSRNSEAICTPIVNEGQHGSGSAHHRAARRQVDGVVSRNGRLARRLRRRLGTKEISPVELMDLVIACIEAL